MEKELEKIFNKWAATYGDSPEDADRCKYGKHLMLEFAQEVVSVKSTAISCWVAFDWMKIETRPTEYGKYLIVRKDGKMHWETWNGSGWAYNHNEIQYWAVILPPV